MEKNQFPERDEQEPSRQPEEEVISLSFSSPAQEEENPMGEPSQVLPEESAASVLPSEPGREEIQAAIEPQAADAAGNFSEADRIDAAPLPGKSDADISLPNEDAGANTSPSSAEQEATEASPEKAEVSELDTVGASGDGSAFMAKIPDTDSDYPEMVTPELGQEITPDENAMRFHGMRNHGEEEPPFDMTILNDPVFSEESQDSPAEEDDSADQEYRDNDQAFDEMMNAPEQKEQATPHPHPVRKGRPKRKRSEWLFGIPNILSTCVWLALIVAIGVTAGRMLWVCAADVLAFGREDKTVTVTVYESDTMDDIIDKLYDGGLIRYKGLFSLYASISNAEEKITAGIYDLNTMYDYHALVNLMSPRSSREVIELTIPEGYTCRQIFALLEENRVCTAVDIGAYAASGELEDYWFLENVTRGDEYCLEGYLFPDTYQFYKNSTPKEALERMLDNFDVRFSEEMRAQIDTLNANVTGGGYTVKEVTIIASLIEKESAAPAESPAIAGVIYNRLFRWGDTPAYLNIDASIIYALDGKTDLTQEDMQVDSPYNTYTHTGLPPTPISNPGLASLQAALSPESHDYYYYVLNPSTGMHQFSSTYEEHSAYVAQFSSAE